MALKKLKLKEIKNKIGAGTISRKNGIITVRRGFFYRHGFSAKQFADKVKEEFPNALIVDYGEHWTTFRGGAPMSESSHWWVKFKLKH